MTNFYLCYGVLTHYFHGFASPVIEEANWLTLPDDIEGLGSYDAVVCLGNSFAHLPDITGDQSEHRYEFFFFFLIYFSFLTEKISKEIMCNAAAL